MAGLPGSVSDRHGQPGTRSGSAELESVSVPTRTREVAPFPADPPWGIRREEVTGRALLCGRSQVG